MKTLGYILMIIGSLFLAGLKGIKNSAKHIDSGITTSAIKGAARGSKYGNYGGQNSNYQPNDFVMVSNLKNANSVYSVTSDGKYEITGGSGTISIDIEVCGEKKSEEMPYFEKEDLPDEPGEYEYLEIEKIEGQLVYLKYHFNDNELPFMEFETVEYKFSKGTKGNFETGETVHLELTEKGMVTSKNNTERLLEKGLSEQGIAISGTSFGQDFTQKIILSKTKLTEESCGEIKIKGTLSDA